MGEAADAWIDTRSGIAGPGEIEHLEPLRGEIAVANAKIAYRRFRELLDTPRWQALARLGAQPSRLLWAFTEGDDHTGGDLRYIEALIGPETVTTFSPANLEAFRDHGRVASTLLERPTHTYETLVAAEHLGLDRAAFCAALLRDGLAELTEAYDSLLAALDPVSKPSRARKGPDRGAPASSPSP
jgi:transaldolase